MKKLLFIVLTFIILFGFTGSAFAYHSTIKVYTTKNNETVLKFTTKNGLQIKINIFKNGTAVERYRQIVKQVKAGKGYYTNYWHKGLAKIDITMNPYKNKLVFAVFKKFGDASYGMIYVHHRRKKVNIFIAKLFPNNHVKTGAHSVSKKIQNLSFKFNYPQPKSGNFSSKLIKIEKTPNKKYFILFKAIDGLEYSVLTNADNKFSNLFVVNPKGSKYPETKLFSVGLLNGNTDIELTRKIAFVYLHSSYSIHAIGRNNTNLYYNFKNFK